MNLAQYIIGALNSTMGARLETVENSVTALRRTAGSSAKDIAAMQARHSAQEARSPALGTGRSSAGASTAASRAGVGAPGGQPGPRGHHLQQQREGATPPPAAGVRDPRGGKNTKHAVVVAGFPGTRD
eukprot:6464297-Pyramimonas_sp.AAC.1